MLGDEIVYAWLKPTTTMALKFSKSFKTCITTGDISQAIIASMKRNRLENSFSDETPVDESSLSSEFYISSSLGSVKRLFPGKGSHMQVYVTNSNERRLFPK